MDRTPLAIVLGLFGFLSYFGLYSADSIRLRIDEMESAALLESRENSELKREVARLELELSQVDSVLESRNLRLTTAEGVVGRLDKANTRIEDLDRSIAAQSLRLENVTKTQASFDPQVIESSLMEMDRAMSERYEAIINMASSAAELAGASQRQLQELDQELRKTSDRQEMWNNFMGPIVQLAGEDSVGSGVLLRGLASNGSEERVDYVLTAWHVVRDIQGSLYNRDMPVPVTIYLGENNTVQETAQLLEFDPVIDVAILLLDAPEPCKNIARLPSVQALSDVRIFDRIYAVGCPLGNDPIPTVGQISALDHDVDGESYFMINAPTYVGNSGGGIFTADGAELLGIFSKVYTHGSLRPTIVTHMGLVTPMRVIYDWFDQIGYGYLVPDANEGISVAIADQLASSESN